MKLKKEKKLDEVRAKLTWSSTPMSRSLRSEEWRSVWPYTVPRRSREALPRNLRIREARDCNVSE